jgi:hypothetical protein
VINTKRIELYSAAWVSVEQMRCDVQFRLKINFLRHMHFGRPVFVLTRVCALILILNTQRRGSVERFADRFTLCVALVWDG